MKAAVNFEAPQKKSSLRGALLLIGVGVAGLLALNFRETFFPSTVEKDLQQTQKLFRSAFEKNKELDLQVQTLAQKNLDFLKQLEEKEKHADALEALLEKQMQTVTGLSRKQQEQERAAALNEIKRKFADDKKKYKSDYQPVRRKDPEAPYDSVPAQQTLREVIPEVSGNDLSAQKSIAEVEVLSPEEKVERLMVRKKAEAALAVRRQRQEAYQQRLLEVKKKFMEAKKNYRPAYDPVRRLETAPPVDSAAAQKQQAWRLVYPPVLKPEQEVPFKEIPAAETPEAPKFALESPEAIQKQLKEEETARQQKTAASENLKTEEPAVKAPVAEETEKTMVRKEAERLMARKEAERLMERKLAQAAAVRSKEESAQAAKAALTEVQKQQAIYYYNLGVAYTEGGSYEDAAEMYEKALALNPQDAAAHYNLGIIYDDHLHKVSEGLIHYKAFLENSQDNKKKKIVEEWIEIAENKERNSGDNYYESAKKAFNTILFANPR